MVVKSGDKFKVVGEKKTQEGKRRSFGEYASRKAAESRLAQVEMFKHMKGKR